MFHKNKLFFLIFQVLICQISIAMEYYGPYHKTLEEIVSDLANHYGGIVFHTDPAESTKKENSAFTYFTPGYVPYDFASNFSQYRNDKHKTLQFPGNYIVVNGPVNNRNGAQNGLSFVNEATRHLSIIRALWQAKYPVTTWQTICYGFWSLQATVYCLASQSQEACEIREKILLPNDHAQAILNHFKLFIVQAPCMKVKRVINQQIASPFAIAEKALEIGISVTACYGIIKYLNKSDLFTPASFGLIFGKPIAGVLYDYYIKDHVKTTITNQIQNVGLPLFTKIDNNKCNARKLMKKLLAETDINSLKHITCAVTWNKEDDIVDTLSVDDLKLFCKLYKFVGCGSPYNTHENINLIQKLILNYVRRLLDEPYDTSERLKNWGYLMYTDIEHIFKGARFFLKNGFEEDATDSLNLLKRYTENEHMLFKKEKKIINYYFWIDEEIKDSDDEATIDKKLQYNLALKDECKKLIDIALNEDQPNGNPNSRLRLYIASKIIGLK